MNLSSNITFANLTCLHINSYIISEYLVPIVSAFGIILNLILVIMLLDKNLKSRCYKYILCKTLIDLFISIFGMISGMSSFLCFTCNEVTASYWLSFAKIYLVAVPLRILFLASALSEIYLSLNRYYDLDNIKNFFTTLSFHVYILIIFTLPIILCVPTFFLTYIDKAYHGPHGFTIHTVSKLYFGIYWLLNSIFETILPTVILIIINALVIVKYKYRMEIKRRTVIRLDGKDAFKRSERLFTLVVILNSGLLACVRSVDLVTGVIFKLQLTGNVLRLNWASVCVFEVFFETTYLLLFSTVAFNTVIYVVIDKNLKKILRRFLRLVRETRKSIVFLILENQ